eukprot:1766356-Pyramimonas_sp.AAC.1
MPAPRGARGRAIARPWGHRWSSLRVPIEGAWRPSSLLDKECGGAPADAVASARLRAVGQGGPL